jgi:hypothetical protein
MFASRKIISASSTLSATAHLLELRDHLFIVRAGGNGGKPVCRCSKFCLVSGPCEFARCGDYLLAR